jgi:DNA polymerase (family 10)/putative hydrolase
MKNWQKYKNHLKTGDWQLHTDYTDGKSTIEDYFSSATENNCNFLFFSEHVRKELSYNYLKFKEEVYRVGSRYKIDFAVGAEVKVLPDMSLDISNSTLDEIDLLSFSYHSKYFTTKEEYIESVLKVVSSDIVDIWAHPTSYPNWVGFDLNREDFDLIFKTIKLHNVVYEFNKKYPLPSLIELQSVKAMNLTYAFSSDAHHESELLTSRDRSFFDNLLINL